MIVGISTHKTKRAITSHPKSVNTRKAITFVDGNPDPGMRRAQTSGGVKTVNGIIIPLLILSVSLS